MDYILQQHLTRWRREPFTWGAGDCMLSIADYLIDVTGIDCADRFRGRYHDQAGCMRVTGYHLDPVALFAGCVAGIPLLETGKPVRHDVGVVRFGRVTAGAICLGKHWAARAERGLVLGKASEVLKAWSSRRDLEGGEAGQ